MKPITVESRFRTSAQIALEDIIFHELFGMIWSNGGYTITSEEDLSWAIMYKDVFLQAVSDYVNEGFIRNSNPGHVVEWVKNSSPFNDPGMVRALRKQVEDTARRFYESKPRKGERLIFERKLEKVRAKLAELDPFSLEVCCEVLGLKIDEVRTCLDVYRKLKLRHKNNIRIVTYTGKKSANIPSFQDIIDAEEANGEHDLTLFLHTGIKRELRNRALARSKNERPNERDSQ
jgi:hypothetical protein